MIALPVVLVGVIILFVIFVAFHSVFPFKACALCAAISTTWIILLIALYAGVSVDPLIIGILMGGTAVGLMQLLSKKLAYFDLFKLPFLLTAIVLIYMILTSTSSYQAIGIVLVLWVITGGIFMSKNNTRIATFGKKIIECCKDW